MAQQKTCTNHPTANEIVRPRQIKAIVGLDRSTVHRMMKAGKFPQAIRLSEKTIGWPRYVLDEWLASRPSVC